MCFRTLQGVWGAIIRNLTVNSGIVPINLGAARLQNGTHTVIHYYDIQPIIEEVRELQNQYNHLTLTLANNTFFKRDLDNYNKIIEHLQSSIEEKLSMLSPNFKRTKRALFNGLGSVIKAITGNLDYKDGDRFEKIIKELTTTSNTLQSQLNLQYTFNKESVKRFEETVKNIEHNELILKSRIMQLTNIIQKEYDIPNVLFAKDLSNQLVILYNTILSILQEIENSITFCHLGTYHPSILKHNELISIMSKIKEKIQLPFDLNNLASIQKIIDVKCKIENHKIIYFLSFPVNYETVFDLYFLLAIPSLDKNGFSTIIPHNRYFLKTDSNVKPLNRECVLENPFQCYQTDLINAIDVCEKEILLRENTNKCQRTRLEINENHIQLVPEINQYLAVFPIQEALKFESKDNLEIKELLGVYLIELQNDSLIFRNEKLDIQVQSFGKPTILSNVNLDLSAQNFSGMKIKLNNLKLSDINLNHLIPEGNVNSMSMESFSYWYMVNYLTLILVLLLILYNVISKYFGEISKIFTRKEVNDLSVNLNQQREVLTSACGQNVHPNLVLPDGAKF